MPSRTVLKGLGQLAVFTVGATLLAWYGFEFSEVHGPIPPFWVLNGYVVGALLVRGKRDWAWLTGANAAALLTAMVLRYGTIRICVFVPIVEPLFAVWLIDRFAGTGHTPPTLDYWVRSMLCAPVAASCIGGAVGAALLLPYVSTQDYPALMRSWWFADALGALIVSPAIVSWVDPSWRAQTRRMFETRLGEFAVFAVLFVVLTLITYGAPPDSELTLDWLRQATLPFLIWAALRFPAWVSSSGIAFVAGYSAWQMAIGRGPFFAEGQGMLVRDVAYQVPMLMTAIGVQMVQVLASERRIASEVLGRSEARFRNIVESTNEWLWEVDADLRFVYSSPHCLPLLGYTPEELIGTDAMSRVLPEDRPAALASFESSVGSGRAIQSFLHRDRRKDGSIVHLESNVVPILDADGKLVGCLGADRDVSDRLASERAESSLREEQAQSEKLVALGTVVSGVAHEINNPNQFITLNMPILRQVWSEVGPAIDEYADRHADWRIAGLGPREVRADVAEAIEEVAEGSDRIRQIVSELREYLRGESDREFEPVDLRRSARSALNIVAPSIAGRPHDVVLEEGPPLPTIRGHRRRIEQVLINLVSNASEAIGDQPGRITIRIALAEDARSVRVEVVDDGPGLAAGDLSRAMDPFFTTKRAVGGMGLGLAISSRIAKEHLGRLELESRPGRGTTARLVLPIAA